MVLWCFDLLSQKLSQGHFQATVHMVSEYALQYSLMDMHCVLGNLIYL